MLLDQKVYSVCAYRVTTEDDSDWNFSFNDEA